MRTEDGEVMHCSPHMIPLPYYGSWIWWVRFYARHVYGLTLSRAQGSDIWDSVFPRSQKHNQGLQGYAYYSAVLDFIEEEIERRYFVNLSDLVAIVEMSNR